MLSKALAENCREFGQKSLNLLSIMNSEQKLNNQNETKELKKIIENIVKKLNDLLPKVHDINKEEIGDLVDQEMQNTSEAIEAAVAKLEV